MKRFWLTLLIVLSLAVPVQAATISSGGGHQIQDEGATPLAQKPKLNFTGDGVSVANPVGQDYTEVNIGQAAIPEPNYYVAGYNADGELINYSTGWSSTLYFYPNIDTFSNVDFETDITGWACSGCTSGPSASTNTYVTGAKSILFQGTGAIVQETITVMAETPYTISAWVHDNSASDYMTLRVRTGSYGAGSDLCTVSTAASRQNQWDRLTCSTPATNITTTLYVQIICSGDSINCYADDFQLSIQDVTPSTVALQDDGFVTCKISNCIAVNGSDTLISVADSASLEPTTGLTLSAWVFPTSEKNGVLIDKGAATQYTLEVVSDTYYDSKIKFKLTNNSSGISQTTTNAYYIYQWTHVVAQISGTAGTGADDTVYFYVNGALVDTITGQNYQMPAHAAGIYIGASTTIFGFMGYMDDIRVYSAAISAADITTMYNSGSGVACTGNETGIIACWNVNETSGTTAVSLPAGFNGTLSASTGSNISGWRNCKLGNCIQFDGVDDYVEVKHGPAMDFTDSFSFSFWLYRGVDTGGNENLLSLSDKDAPTTIRDYAIFVRVGTTDKIEVYTTKKGQGFVYLVGLTSISVGQWYHAVVIKSSTEFKIYLNNVLDTNGIAGGWMGPVVANKLSLLLGTLSDSGAATYGFSGKLDELQMYNTVLGTSEINALYNSGSGAACSGSETGLTACWHFNELSGQVTYQTKNQTGIGSDANNCITSSTPCKTYQAVINKIPQYYAGTTVVNIASVSMFPENPIINGYNNSGNYTLTLRGYSNPTPNQFTDVATLSGTSTGSNTANFPKDTLSLFNNTNIHYTANNGTLTNGPTWLDGSPSAECGPGTTMGGCLSFSSVSPGDYVDAGDQNSTEDISAITIMFWVKGLAANSDTFAALVAKGNDSDGTGSWQIQKRNTFSNIRIAFTNSTTMYTYLTTTDVLDDNWHHVVAVYNGTDIRAYIDGAADATSPTSMTGAIKNTTCKVTIGDMDASSACSSGTWDTRAFTGIIDEVAIFNKALSLSEIQTYCGWSGSVCNGYHIPDTTSDLISIYHNEEGLGTTTYDTAQAAFSGDVAIGDLLYIDSGPSVGSWARVQSKQSATQLAVISQWGTIPTSSSTYQIFSNKYLPQIHAQNGTYGLTIKNSSGIGLDRLGIIKSARGNLFVDATKLSDIYRSVFKNGGYIGLGIEALSTANNIQYNFSEYNAGEAIRLYRSSTINSVIGNFTRGGLAGFGGYWSSSVVNITTNLFDMANYAAFDVEQNFTSYGLRYNRMSRSGYAGLAVANNSSLTAVAPNTITSNHKYGLWLSTTTNFNADFYGGLLLSDFEIKSNSDGVRGQYNSFCLGSACSSFTYSGNTTNIRLMDSASILTITAPTVSSCGTSPSVTSTSRTNSGSATIGGGTVTSCTLTFPVTWDSAPFCTVTSNNTGVTLASSSTTTALTITSSATMNGHVIKYNCGLAQ